MFLDFWTFAAIFDFFNIFMGGLGVFPLDAPRNSTRFGATNASRALTAVQFRLATVALLVLGTWYQVLGTWLLGTKYLVLGTKYQVLGTWYQVLSTWYLVPST